jgi:hypothetical protein
MNECIFCYHELVNVIYGYPSQKLIDLAKTDGIALGGIFSKGAPKFYCYGCHAAY